MKSCLSQISNLYDKMSYSEHVLADEALAHPENIVYKSIHELADSLHIAPSTIVATTKKLGYSGFREFKIALASEMINPISQNQDVKQGEESIFVKVITSNIQGLEEALNSLPQSYFDEAASIISESKMIYIMGIGTSGIIARELHDYLFRLGIECSIITDQHHQLLVANRIEGDTSAILISQSGVNKDIIKIGEMIQHNGGKSIGISNFLNTPFAKSVNTILAPFKSPTAFHENNFTMRIPMMAIIENLYYTLSKLLADRYQSSVEENKKVIISTSISAQVK